MIGNILNLKQLEALVWVADLGSFRKAAHHLNTTQPNISSRIAGLEQSFGISLMLRDAGSVRMTAKGAVFLKQAREILRESEKLVDIASRPDLVNNRLRLGVTELIAATWLRPYMVRMKEAYPNVSVELTVDLSWQLDKELSAGSLDLAIQSEPFAAPVSGTIELGSYEYVWVANVDVARQIGAGDISRKALMKHPILTHTRQTQAYLELTERFGKSAGDAMRLAPSNSMAAAVHMALDGMGIAVLPRSVVAAQLAEETLVEIHYSWRPSPLKFAARFHAEKATRFVRHAAEIAAECAAKFQRG
ncbi:MULTISPECIES: LysR family transcriptional regulator [Falsihalocynthiibacter]|uniref:LysR family transcriptional regulator n=1 Tax=Falsihalocynthiibacter TaxID=2854182 RepID=UPI0030033CED